MSELQRYELEDVEYREYDFHGRVYRIEKPVAFYWKVGATTHRVIDAKGVVHLVPAPGEKGCVVRYEKVEGADPCKF